MISGAVVQRIVERGRAFKSPRPDHSFQLDVASFLAPE